MMHSLAARHTQRHQAGVGMLEVLIAVLIVSIGFLGMAALQAKALSTNNSAMARSMATVASYSILDAMRADSAAADSGAYNLTVTANACGSIGGGSLAATQLTQWCNQLGSSLGAVATTTGNIGCTNTGICTVTITFNDSRAGNAGTSGNTGTQKVVTVAGL